MDFKTIIAAALVSIAFAFGVVSLAPDKTVEVPGLGALSGPDIPSLYLNWGGVRIWNGGEGMVQATTTVCAIQGPAATSTLLHASVKIDVASSTATIWDVAKASTAFATTTAIGTPHAVGAGTQDFILASTSPSAGDAVVFGPNQWLVVGVRQGVSGNGALFVPQGRCQASFVESPTL